MAQVRILLMPGQLRREMVLVNAEKAPVIKAHLEHYLMLPPMEVNLPQWLENSQTSSLGEAYAEEIFDLTNNPSREDERQERYGNGQSLSSGDVVRTPEGDFLCCSFGWAKL